VKSEQLLDKVAIVTGASSGIGLATALALAEHGSNIALAARNVPALEQVARQVEALGRQALVVCCDVPEEDQVRSLIAETIARWGRIDILVANAGQYIRAPIADLTVPDVERAMAVNFYGSLHAVLAVLPHMLAQRSGNIILVTSMDAFTPLPPDAPYVAAKSAMTGFGEVLRQELHGTGVYATTVLPGRVDTPLLEGIKVPWISAKISPDAVARSIVRAVERHPARVILPPQAKLLYYLNVFAPGLADWAVRFLHLDGWEEK
jgi:NAD(P)-dependent dehydrogenase (short-subunit alcohol dehydrogenase family)